MLKTLVANTAAIITTACFLPQVLSVFKARDTKAVSLISYITLFIGTILWVCYGFIVHEIPIIISNTIIASCSLLVVIKKIKISKKVSTRLFLSLVCLSFCGRGFLFKD